MKRLLLAAAAGLGCILAILLPASCVPAVAVPLSVVAHADGFTWDHDHLSWIGSYRLSDGSSGFCLDVTKPPPVRTSFTTEDGSNSGRWTEDESARLAYLVRTWGGDHDPVVAAAVALTAWRLTGLGGHDAGYYAQRANAEAAHVLSASDWMMGRLSAAEPTASRSVSVRLDLDPAGWTATAQLSVDYVAGGPRQLPPGSHTGTVRVSGAVFDDGSTERSATNGEQLRLHPVDGRALVDIVVETEFTGLPYGRSFVLARGDGRVQDLLLSEPPTSSVRASASMRTPSPLPFAPQVETVTSTAAAEPGAELTDRLTVSARPGPDLGEWGVYDDGRGGVAPVPVVVQSSLLGPFAEAPTPAPLAPDDAPVACTVETLASRGPGEYVTPPCRIEQPGWYVWIETIDPGRTPPEHGGDRVRPWASSFGVASEVTVVTAPPSISTIVDSAVVQGDGCVRDRLTVTGVAAGSGSFEVESVLLGPFPDRPAPGQELRLDDTLPVAGRTTTTVDGEGELATSCLPVSRPGHYVFVLRSPGRPDRLGGVPPFADTTVYESETVLVTAAPPARLASTGAAAGADGVPVATATAAALAIVVGSIGSILRARGLSLGGRRR